MLGADVGGVLSMVPAFGLTSSSSGAGASAGRSSSRSVAAAWWPWPSSASSTRPGRRARRPTSPAWPSTSPTAGSSTVVDHRSGRRVHASFGGDEAVIWILCRRPRRRRPRAGRRRRPGRGRPGRTDGASARRTAGRSWIGLGALALAGSGRQRLVHRGPGDHADRRRARPHPSARPIDARHGRRRWS